MAELFVPWSSGQVKALGDAKLYGILDLAYVSRANALQVAESLIEGGIDILQLRAKDSDEAQIEALGTELIRITEPTRVPLIINDYPQLVPAIGAQGAHVGQDDFTVADARWRAGRALAEDAPRPVIGKSTHSLAQATAAASESADYLGFGPLFTTPTKPGRPAIGLAEIRRVQELVSIPVFCIGGINLETLDEVVAAGARRVVIVSALLRAADIVSYAREVRAHLEAAD
ncbi:MAG TPA: thiamine phosphate synthase [Chthoniobacteraceae bacterium]|nr:thiamine phosphate synthase [Chthoniobacteraceae bacterium]